MPGIDGVEATRRIARAAEGPRVVVLTSFADREHISEALDSGAVGYLLKDSDPDELVSGVRAAAAGESPLTPRVALTVVRELRGSAPTEALSDREREVLALVGAGVANKQIALRLGISPKTVKSHLSHIFRRIGVQDRLQAAMWARRHGLVEGVDPGVRAVGPLSSCESDSRARKVSVCRARPPLGRSASARPDPAPPRSRRRRGGARRWPGPRGRRGVRRRRAAAGRGVRRGGRGGRAVPRQRRARGARPGAGAARRRPRGRRAAPRRRHGRARLLRPRLAVGRHRRQARAARRLPHGAVLGARRGSRPGAGGGGGARPSSPRGWRAPGTGR